MTTFSTLTTGGNERISLCGLSRHWPRLQEEAVLPPSYKMVLLHAQEKEDDHMAQNIANMIQNSLREWVDSGNIICSYMVITLTPTCWQWCRLYVSTTLCAWCAQFT